MMNSAIANPGCRPTIVRTQRSKGGVVLFAVLAALTALALLAGGAAVMVVHDVRMTSQFLRMGDAINAADAGAQYVKARIQADLASGDLTLSNAVESVSYAAPSPFSFDPVTALVQTANPDAYYFTVIGHAADASAEIEVVFRRRSVFEMGLFGDELVDAKADAGIYSYDSRLTANPTASDSTGQAYVGSNEDFVTRMNTVIDGTFALGENESGEEGEWTELPSGGSLVSGEAAISTDRVDPDPLGAGSGSLAVDFAYYATSNHNDNASASPPIEPPHCRIRLMNGDVMTLPSGNYYVTDVVLHNGASLNVDASGGPVTVYLTGGFEAMEGSAINWTGAPSDFTLYSNSSDAIILKHDGDFKGVIYAPFADVQIRNSASFYGLVWADELDIKNSGDIFMDLAAQRNFLSSAIVFLSWKDIRNY